MSQRPGDGALLDQVGDNRLTKRLLQRRQRQWRHNPENAIRCKYTIRRKHVDMRMEINQVAEGLYE